MPTCKKTGCQGRKQLIQDTKDKIACGSNRVKKRTRTVKKKEAVTLSSKLKGTFVEYETYKKDRDQGSVFIKAKIWHMTPDSDCDWVFSYVTLV